MTVEKLNEKINVCISKNHRFGSDAFLLADFSAPRKKDRVIDLGTGCGIIPSILSKRFLPRQIVGVELQDEAVNLFKKSIEMSQHDTNISVIQADIKNLCNNHEMNATFDVVTCNPPYKIEGRGIISATDADKIARHETMCTIDDVCKAGANLLNFGGKLCICQRPERLLDVMAAMRNNGIEPKRVRFVAKEQGTAPWLFLVEGKKGAKPFLQVEPTFYMYVNGETSDALRQVYGNIEGV